MMARIFFIVVVKLEYGSRNGEQRRVETVEHTAMAGQDVAAVLHSEGTLQQTLYQIAPGAEDNDDQSQTEPLLHGQHTA